MENSQSENLKSSQNPPVTVHRHRRWPFRSNTYRVFAQIMSHCAALQQRKTTGESVEDNKLVGVDGLEEAAKISEPLDHDSMEIEKLLVQGEDTSMVEDNLLDSMTIITDDKNDSVMEYNQTIAGISDSIISQKDSFNIDDSTEVILMRLEEVDKELSLDEVPQAVNSSWEMDMITEFSDCVMHDDDDDDDEKKATEEKTIQEGIEHELLLKEIELKKLMFSSTLMNSPHCNDIEEGEISGDAEIQDEATDEPVSLEKEGTKDSHKDIIDKEETAHDVRETARICARSSSSCLDIKDNGKDVILERQSTIKDPNVYSESLAGRRNIEIKRVDEHGVILETGQVMDQNSEVQGTDQQAASAKVLTSCLQVKSEDRTKSKDLVTTEKDNGVETKKRKRIVTKERKAKKKRKNRIKRAENNRKLGVKRLKLQPVLKPKKVTYCRHYLRGRCHEGENCKFSHDTIPLTKSQPCSHFARHSCMKGDDCPYDHQLSKYPCNNYATTGYCSRGSDCLFSHQMSEIGGHSLTSKVPKSEAKSSFQANDSNSKKKLNVHKNPPQTSDDKGAKKEIMQILQRPITQVPKGISVLSHGDTSKHIKAIQHLKEGDNGVKVGLEVTSSSLESQQKPNDMTKKTPTVKPKGINFLSFGKAPQLDSGNKKNHGVSESHSCELNQSSSSKSSKENGGVESENPSSRSFPEPESTKTKAQNSTPSAASRPEGIKFLSLAEVPGDNSRENAVDRFTFSNGMECRSTTPSSNPFRLSSYQTDPRNAVGIMSSSQKTSLLPSSVQKTIQSTLAFAATIDSNIKLNQQTGTSAAN